ncbi:MAG: nucleotidyltransferase family protein [Candidatus Riflebacteria bacterium]|nr:nucleotidyltransferase family protein [Candidatus Riflebacteria bacterium]
MKEWKSGRISPEISILETMRVIDDCLLQIALIVDPQDRLLGVINDGDIRRAIVRGVPLSQPVKDVMIKKFTFARPEDSNETILHLMHSKQLRQIPIIDSDGRLIDLKMLDFMLQVPPKENWVVLMAGGLGYRLNSLTKNCPKPLLEVGKKPLLKTTIENFIGAGFSRFFISVNYMGEKIEEYFGNGSTLGVSIEYLREDKRLGTAGALSLLKNHPSLPIIVMNGDILTRINFQHLLDFHLEKKSKATMCTREYSIQIPYGVVKTDGTRLREIEEKPVNSFLANAGIYVLEPETVKLVPSNTFFDMPDLFREVILRGMETHVFPIREYWVDIGHIDDFEKANGEYLSYF